MQPARGGGDPGTGGRGVHRGLPPRSAGTGSATGTTPVTYGTNPAAGILAGFRDPRQPCGSSGAHSSATRLFRLRGLHQGDSGSEPAPLPLSLHQLHPMRSALHPDPRPALRPAQHGTGGLSPVRGLRGGIPRSRRPPLSRRTPGLPGLWTTTELRRTGKGAYPGQRRCPACRREYLAPASRAGHQGRGRLPPGV